MEATKRIEIARAQFKIADLIGEKRVRIGLDVALDVNGVLENAGTLEIDIGGVPTPADGEPGPSNEAPGTMTVGVAQNSDG